MSDIEVKGEDDCWVFDSLVNFLRGAIWKLPVMGFVEEKSVVFDPDSYNDMTEEKEEEFRKIHEDYKTLVDYMLTSFMEDLQVSPEQVEEACQLRGESINRSHQESLVTKVALEQLWAAEDFNTFRRLMTRKNIDLQLQSLELLVAKYGVLSPSLCSGEVSSSENGEEDFLQVVIRYSDQSEKLHNETFSSTGMKTSFKTGLQTNQTFPEYESVLLHNDCNDASNSSTSTNTTTTTTPTSATKTSSTTAPQKTIQKEKKQTIVEKDSKDTTKAKNQVALSAQPQREILPSQILEQERHAAALQQLENDEEAEGDDSASVEDKVPSKSVQHKRDEVTVAEIASVAPEQHRMLTSVRKALEVDDDEFTSISESPALEMQRVGTEEEIQRRREYLSSQRDKLVALKKKEREKQLSNNDALAQGGAGHSKRPKSARAAKIALTSVAGIPGTGTNDKALAARRALADRLKQELISEK